MTIGGAFAILIALGSLFFAILSAFELRDLRRARQHNRTSQIRTRFAVLRHELVMLGAHGAVDTHHRGFKSLYALQTHVMRRPDQYSQLAKELTQAFLSSDPSRSAAAAEELQAVSDDPRYQAVLVSTGNALCELIAVHDPAYRVLDRIGAVQGALAVLALVDRFLEWLVNKLEGHARERELTASTDIRQISRILVGCGA